MSLRNPDLSFYGQLSGRFPMFVKTAKVIKKIRDGSVPPTVRAMCYDVGNLESEFLVAVAHTLNTHISRFDAEIYVPDGDYPAHTDSGGISFMIPLEHGCTATIGGVLHDLKPWGVYSFDDGSPHATQGGMLMLKPKPVAPPPAPPVAPAPPATPPGLVATVLTTKFFEALKADADSGIYIMLDKGKVDEHSAVAGWLRDIANRLWKCEIDKPAE